MSFGVRLRHPVRHVVMGLLYEGLLFLGTSDARGFAFMSLDMSEDVPIMLVSLWAERTLEWFSVAMAKDEVGM